jgi:hypothetical protein
MKCLQDGRDKVWIVREDRVSEGLREDKEGGAREGRRALKPQSLEYKGEASLLKIHDSNSRKVDSS